MYKFDGSDSEIWVAQMEQYFILNDIQDDQTRLCVGALYLDQEIWKWWQWHQKSYLGNITWQMFSKYLCECIDRASKFLGRLTKLQ